MSGFLIAPTEPDEIKSLGKVSSAPERNGADILWATKGYGLVGIQRKELNDLVSSIHDGRLAKEVAQMQGLKLRGLIVEGRGRWTRDGALINEYTQSIVTKEQIKKLLLTVRSKGVWVDWTDNIEDTCETLRWLKDWSEKEAHTSLHTRPGPTGRDGWGTVSNKDYAIHLLTSMPNVGPVVAENILEHFGGVPLEWRVGKEDLMEVPGVGKVRAEKMMKVLEAA